MWAPSISRYDRAMELGDEYGGRMAASHVTSFARDLSDDLRIVYEDDGVGIEAGDRERLFERGFGKNTGLDLYLCGEILDLTGASIIEAGKPGGGARFEIRFPSRHWRDA